MKIIRKFFGVDTLEAEKSRLEAFLAAFPGEYCGFAKDRIVAYSTRFPEILGLNTISDFTDIQHALRPGDAAALEGCFHRLQDEGTRFSLKTRSLDGAKLWRLTGSKGRDTRGVEDYDILWLEDVTAVETEIERTRDAHAGLESSRRLMQTALDAFNYPVWIRDRDQKLVWCNRRFAELLVTTPDAAVAGQKDLNFTRKAGSRSVGEMERDAASTNKVQRARRYIIVGGDRKLFEVQITPAPHLDLTIGQARDVTAYEDNKKESERNAAANLQLLEALSTPVCLYDGEYRIEFYNTAYAQLWHLDEQWLNTRPKMVDIIERLREVRMVPEQADFRLYKQELLDTFSKLIAPWEEMHYLPNGMTLRMLVVPRPTGGVMILWEDVTRRLELESSYNTLVAVQKETLDNLSEGVAAFGSDGRLKLWNPSYARMWNLNPEDMEGNPHISRLVEKQKTLFAETDRVRAREMLFSQALERTQIEGTLRRDDGTVLEYISVPLPDGGMLVTHIDVTDTIRVENALREKTAALEAAERLKLEFIANVSYQLRTPLNAIIGFTEILDKEYFGALNDRQKGYTRGLSEAGERLMSLINDILDLASIEAGYMALETGSMDIHAMLRGLFDLTQEWARSQRIEVTLSCPKDIGSVAADERRIKQILLNLIRNSIEFTQAGGRIQLSAERRGDHALLSVSDNGPGISKEDQEKIFKPFEKTDGSREDSDNQSQSRGGAGLGLTLVKDIVELHGGYVTLDSEVGKGTTTTLFLPA